MCWCYFEIIKSYKFYTSFRGRCLLNGLIFMYVIDLKNLTL